MKVGLLCVGWPGRHEVGGAARYGYRLAQELAPLVDLTIITSEGGIPVDGAQMVYLPEHRGRFKHYYGFPIQARKRVAELKLDIVHAFGDDWALQPSAPIVRTFHGSSLSEARSSTGLRKLNHHVLALLEGRAARRATVKIGVGPESFEFFGCDYLIPPIAPIRIDGARMPSEVPSVIFMGAWGGRKRGHLVEEALRSVREKLGNVSLVVIGPEDDRKNWSADVDHISGANDEAVQRVLRDSWLLVAPSSYEGFGIPAFEALSLGVPVIATPNPGSLYLDDAFSTPGALTIVEPEQLSSAIENRLSRGPWLDSHEADAVFEVSRRMLDVASPRFLVDSIYRPLLKG